MLSDCNDRIPADKREISENPSGVKEFLSWKIRVRNFKEMTDSNPECS